MKQAQFLDVVDKTTALQRLFDALDGAPSLAVESLPLQRALGRVVAEDVTSEVDVPGFDRANMDGYAVRAADTFGATEATPTRLKCLSEEVIIGQLPDAVVSAGSAIPIPTGGAMPRGADAVVMVEATERTNDGAIDVRRAVTAGTAMSFAGTDIARGQVVLRAGDTLSSREIGVLAAVGRATVKVRCKPRVAIVSTGNELSPVGTALTPGRVYDSNALILEGAVRECGAEPVALGIAADDHAELTAALREALACADVVLFSGGTSKGPGDLNAIALEDVLAPPGVLVHGVALKPGKPICIAVSETTPVIVLPGFPTSAIFTFHEFVAPLLKRMLGAPHGATAASVEAILPQRFRSVIGRRQYVMTHLVTGPDERLLCYPIRKGSGSVTTWSHADGFFAIDHDVEQVPAGSTVKVWPIAGGRTRRADLVVVGSHCMGLDILLSAMRERGYETKLVVAGSEGGLAAARAGVCDIAGVHLLDAETGTYNQPFVDERTEFIPGYGRMQGLVFRANDARFALNDTARIGALLDAHPELRMVNRNAGSGTRVLIDELLQGRRPDGYAMEASSHQAVATAVEQGRADFSVAIDVAARERQLGFLPVKKERFDFLMPQGRKTRAAVQHFCELLQDAAIVAQLRKRGFDA